MFPCRQSSSRYRGVEAAYPSAQSRVAERQRQVAVVVAHRACGSHRPCWLGSLTKSGHSFAIAMMDHLVDGARASDTALRRVRVRIRGLLNGQANVEKN